MIQDSTKWDLPPELTLHIFSFLGVRDLANMRCCHQLDQLIKDEKFWKAFSKKIVDQYFQHKKLICQYTATFTSHIFFKGKKKCISLPQLNLKIQKFEFLKTASKTKEFMLVLAGGLPNFLKIPISNEHSMNLCRGVDSESQSFIAYRWTNDHHHFRAVVKHSQNNLLLREEKDTQPYYTYPVIKDGLITIPYLVTMIQKRIALNLLSLPS